MMKSARVFVSLMRVVLFTNVSIAAFSLSFPNLKYFETIMRQGR
jgi:hypothetical protein